MIPVLAVFATLGAALVLGADRGLPDAASMQAPYGQAYRPNGDAPGLGPMPCGTDAVRAVYALDPDGALRLERMPEALIPAEGRLFSFAEFIDTVAGAMACSRSLHQSRVS